MGAAKDAKRPAPKRRQRQESSIPPVLIEVEKRGNLYSVVDPALEIAVSKADLTKAYNEFIRLRSAVLEKMTEAGFPAPDYRIVPAQGIESAQQDKADAPPTDAVPQAAPGAPLAEALPKDQADRRRASGRSWFAGIAAVVVILVIALAMIPVLSGIRAANLGMARLKEAAKPENVSRLASQSIVEFAEALKRVTPARREEIRKSLRIIAQELRPYASELAPMFDAEEPSLVRRQSGGQRRGR